MNTILVKDLMIPVESYTSVPLDASLYEAVVTLEKSQNSLDPLRYRHRAVFVLDRNGSVIGKMNMKNILSALKPDSSNKESEEVLSRLGYSPDLIQSLTEKNILWIDPLQIACDRVRQMAVIDVVEPPRERELIDEEATLREALHKLLVYPLYSLLVVRDEFEIIGILRLSDVFATICREIRACEP